MIKFLPCPIQLKKMVHDSCKGTYEGLIIFLLFEIFSKVELANYFYIKNGIAYYKWNAEKLTDGLFKNLYSNCCALYQSDMAD